MSSSFDSDSSGLTVRFAKVSKRFHGVRALDELSMEIPAASTCALIGANGAGKTTSFSLLGGFLRGYSGAITVGAPGSAEISVERYRRSGGVVGLMPQDVQGFDGRSIESQLRLFSRLAGRTAHDAAREVDELIEATDLHEHRRKKPSELSHGMRARFGIAQAFIGAPGMVLLDEPTSGLDPLHLAQVRELLARFRGRTTLVVSSHDLSELQSWCDYVVMMEKGRCVKQGALDTFLTSNRRVVRFTIAGTFSSVALKDAFPEISLSVQGDEVIVHGELREGLLIKVLGWFETQRCSVLAFDRRGSLEEAYLQQVKRN